MVEVIGIDHIYIAVSDFARAEAFYDRLMPVLGFRKSAFTLGSDPHVQYYNRHLGYVLRPARNAVPHDPYAPGLHHLCWRVDAIADLHIAARELRAAGIEVGEPEPHAQYAPDYWAIFFTDPDSLRLEITNYRQERRERHDRWDALGKDVQGHE